MTDRLPPQNLDAEQAVLGSILIDRDAIIEVADFLTPDDFYRQAHSRIFAAMLGLSERGEPIDIVTVAEALERSGELEAVGGAGYLSQLGNDTPTAVHVEQYGHIVERKALLRRLIGSAGRIAAIGYEDGQDVQESIDRAEAELFAVSQRRAKAGFSQLVDLLHQAYDRLDYLHAHRGEIMGIPSGFRQLDLLTTGFQPSDFIVLAARPSLGKTSLALNVAEYAAVQEGKTVGIFSLEMSKEQLVQRLLSSVATIDSDRLRSGFLEDLDFARIAPAMEKLSKAPLFIDDTPAISTMELRTKARRLKAEHGLDLLIVDYLQLMMPGTPTRDGNRVAEVSDISRGLKALARELQVPIIALSQLSRESERMGGRDPRLSDLRESGAIEQDADLVMLLSRPRPKKKAGARGEEEEEPAPDSAASANGEVIKLNLAKHRNGPTGELQLWFYKRQTRFVTYVEDRYAEAV
jgi:replicative DNA helicase